jgi:hypothetical protein
MTTTSLRATPAATPPVTVARAGRLLAMIAIAVMAGLFFVQARAVLDDAMFASMVTLLLVMPLTSLLRGDAPKRRRP